MGGRGDRNSRGLFSVRRPNAKSLKTTPSRVFHGQEHFYDRFAYRGIESFVEPFTRILFADSFVRIKIHEGREGTSLQAETTKDVYRQDLLTSEHELSINGRRI